MRGGSMAIRSVLFYLGCAAAWLVLLPVLAVAGCLALLSYAVFSEFSEVLFGRPAPSLDHSKAREMAHRMCAGH
jgi:hypothetical protein